MPEVPSLTPRHAVPAEGGGEPERIDRYELVEVIGKGAMGVVYRAWDPLVERMVALKCLVVPAGATPGQRRELESRFSREAHAASRLSHPNIVTAYDHGEGYLAMELVDGLPLDRHLRGRMEPALALSILEQVAAALDHAHGAGVIHRDVKPANILVTSLGVAKVADFGLAKLEEDVAAGRSWDAPLGETQGGIVGTPTCMAPEQVLGEEVSPATDRFALAVMAYVLLTGRRPFAAESIDGILHRIVNDSAPSVVVAAPGLPASLDRVFRRGLAKRPGDRHATARALVDDLRGALDEEPAPPGGQDASDAADGEEGDDLLAPLLSILALLAGLGAAILFVLRLQAPQVVAPAEVRAPVPESLPAKRAPAPGPVSARTPVPRPTQQPREVEPERPVRPAAESAPPAAQEPPVTLLAPVPAATVEPSVVRTSGAAEPAERDESWGLTFFEEPAPLTGGAQVRAVVEGSPAWEAGLRMKDVVVRWQGVQVWGPSDIARLAVAPGTTEIAVDFLRDVNSTLQRSQTAIRTAPDPEPAPLDPEPSPAEDDWSRPTIR